MGILSWIVLGLIVGVLAKWIMPGKDPGGFILTIASLVVVANTVFFVFSLFPVTHRWIRNHDRDLKIMLDAISRTDRSATAVFVGPYIFFGYRQIMYYLPEYPVYQMDVRTSPTGETRKIFGGIERRTVLSDGIVVPDKVRTFIMPLIADDRDIVARIGGVRVDSLERTDIALSRGDISLIEEVYPEVKIRVLDDR